jgi:hypothetical protein
MKDGSELSVCLMVEILVSSAVGVFPPSITLLFKQPEEMIVNKNKIKNNF